MESEPGNSNNEQLNPLSAYDPEAIEAMRSYILTFCPALEDQDALFTPGEVGNMLKIDPKVVSRWSYDGLLKCIKTPGRIRRFRSKDIMESLLVANLKERDE